MNHLLIVAHPLPDSVTMKLAQAYARELELQGHVCAVHDLYRMHFDPVLSANELDPRGETPAAVRTAQDAVAACDTLAVVYPLWWASMPAMLKGYVDRVFARGFAYEGEGGRTRGLLAGRSCLLMTLSGAPLQVLDESGEWRAIQMLQDTHIFRSCGFSILEHLHFDLVEPPTSPDALSTHLARVRDCVRRHFMTPAPPDAARGAARAASSAPQ